MEDRNYREHGGVPCPHEEYMPLDVLRASERELGGSQADTGSNGRSLRLPPVIRATNSSSVPFLFT